MDHQKQLIEDIAAKIKQGSATEDEIKRFDAWYNSHPDDAYTLPKGFASGDDELKNRIHQHIKNRLKPLRKPAFNWIYAAAAIILVALATALYFYPSLIVNRTAEIVNEIGPGGNRATLTLADGTKVNLDSAKAGIQVNNEAILYNDGTAIEAKSIVNRKSEIVNSTMLTLSTPKGGQYQIMLEDGTKVWLNAASTLTYPSKFTGDNRAVFLEGEAYFEVAKIEKHKAKSQEVGGPFVVRSQNQEITVLGTSFNITAFADEKETKTTLVEGKVQVKSQNLTLKTYNVKLLAPKQQAVVKGDSLTVQKADIESTTAWKNGDFYFDGAALESIMAQISRWYNIDVRYEGQIKNREFGGSISRHKPLSDVLSVLQQTGGVRFQVNGREVTVMP